MPTVHKIALFGIGNIGRIICSGAAALTLSETKTEKSDWDFDMLKVTAPVDRSVLVKAYKNVQRKYYPEKDVLINNLTKRSK